MLILTLCILSNDFFNVTFLGLKHPRAWLPAKEEVFEKPLERRRLEGRREFEGRLALAQHGAAGAKGSARL